MVESMADEVNKIIKYDGYQLQKNGDFFKIVDTTGNVVVPNTITEINHDFVSEQIKKCQEKIGSGDFNGAITNSRTLAEAIMIHIIETNENISIKNDGNLVNLWNRAKKALKINLDKNDVPDFVFQIVAGLETSINGLAATSNNAGDRHANKFNTKKHHAKLAVNATMTICDFLIDVLNERKK